MKDSIFFDLFDFAFTASLLETSKFSEIGPIQLIPSVAEEIDLFLFIIVFSNHDVASYYRHWIIQKQDC